MSQPTATSRRTIIYFDDSSVGDHELEGKADGVYYDEGGCRSTYSDTPPADPGGDIWFNPVSNYYTVWRENGWMLLNASGSGGGNGGSSGGGTPPLFLSISERCKEIQQSTEFRSKRNARARSLVFGPIKGQRNVHGMVVGVSSDYYRLQGF